MARSVIFKNIDSTFHKVFFNTFALCCFFLLKNASTSAQETFSNSEAYLLREVSARAIGMSGAYTAVANESNALFYNPAALSLLSAKPSISTTYSILQAGRQHAVLSYAQSFADNQFGIGAGINSFAAGSFTGRDALGNSLGTLTNQQLGLALGGAYNAEFMSFGATVKYLFNNLQGSDAAAQGFALDLGAKTDVAELFSFGISVQNLVGFMKWNAMNESEAIPYVIRAGVATEFGFDETEIIARTNVRGEIDTIEIPATRYVMVSLESVLRQFASTPDLILATEILPIEVLAIRGGITLLGEERFKTEFFPASRFGTGLSLRLPGLNMPFQMQLDYAISRDNIASAHLAHTLSLLAEF
ncbi:MAG TPA: PorV/PorQ family protein [Patescibacteria group bacterium]|nr:PorV/PorQ family protein [Patescibacteria group bacterium]